MLFVIHHKGPWAVASMGTRDLGHHERRMLNAKPQPVPIRRKGFRDGCGTSDLPRRRGLIINMERFYCEGVRSDRIHRLTVNALYGSSRRIVHFDKLLGPA